MSLTADQTSIYAFLHVQLCKVTQTIQTDWEDAQLKVQNTWLKRKIVTWLRISAVSRSSRMQTCFLFLLSPLNL